MAGACFDLRSTQLPCHLFKHPLRPKKTEETRVNTTEMDNFALLTFVEARGTLLLPAAIKYRMILGMS